MKKLAFLSAGILAFALQGVSAQTLLWNTVDDFTGATANKTTNETVSVVSWSSSSSTVNGAGNTGVGNGVGGTGTPGSIQIQFINQPSYQDWVAAWLPLHVYSPSIISAIDPGGTAAWQPPSYPNGTTVAYSGSLQLDYSVPDNEGGSYFKIGVDLSYAANSYYGAFFATSADTDLGITDPNGYEMYRTTIPYTITAGSANLGGLGFGIIVNSDYGSVMPFTVDNIQVVPEPGTMALFGLGTLGFAFLARRRRA